MAQDWPEDEPTGPPDAPQGHREITPDLAERICHLIAAGTAVPKALVQVGVSRGQFWSRHARDGAFRDAVYQARLMGVEALADEILEIADSRADPRHRAVQIEARKWLLTKLMPRRYGDKVDLQVTTQKEVERMTDAEIVARLKAIRGGAASDGAAEAGGGSHEPPTVH